MVKAFPRIGSNSPKENSSFGPSSPFSFNLDTFVIFKLFVSNMISNSPELSLLRVKK